MDWRGIDSDITFSLLKLLSVWCNLQWWWRQRCLLDTASDFFMINSIRLLVWIACLSCLIKIQNLPKIGHQQQRCSYQTGTTTTSHSLASPLLPSYYCGHINPSSIPPTHQKSHISKINKPFQFQLLGTIIVRNCDKIEPIQFCLRPYHSPSYDQSIRT